VGVGEGYRKEGVEGNKERGGRRNKAGYKEE
jgi:hypothetical protein